MFSRDAFVLKNRHESEEMERKTSQKSGARFTGKSDIVFRSVCDLTSQAQCVFDGDSKTQFSRDKMQSLFNCDVTEDGYMNNMPLSVGNIDDIGTAESLENLNGRFSSKTQQQFIGKDFCLNRNNLNGMYDYEEHWEDQNGCKSDKILGFNVKHEKRISPFM